MRIGIMFILFFKITFTTAGYAQSKSDGDNTKTLDYPYSEREKFVNNIQNELMKIDMKIKSLQNQSDELYGLTGEETEKQIDAIKAQSTELGDELDHAKNSTESGWDGTKARIYGYLADLQSQVNRTAAYMNNRIESFRQYSP